MMLYIFALFLKAIKHEGIKTLPWGILLGPLNRFSRYVHLNHEHKPNNSRKIRATLKIRLVNNPRAPSLDTLMAGFVECPC